MALNVTAPNSRDTATAPNSRDTTAGADARNESNSADPRLVDPVWADLDQLLVAPEAGQLALDVPKLEWNRVRPALPPPPLQEALVLTRHLKD